MRFRQIFWWLTIPAIILMTIAAGRMWIHRLQSKSDDVNREDSKRVVSVALNQTDWREFTILPDAEGIRITVNAALRDTEHPATNQSDPRTGWRFSVIYQLIAADGRVIRNSDYQIRSRLRKLVDADDGSLIDPLVFGKTGLTATQSRVIQIPIDDDCRPVRLRVKAKFDDPDIAEIVARVKTRSLRPNYRSPALWKKIPLRNRRSLTKYSVFDHQFLTVDQRQSLLKWQWTLAPTTSEAPLRHLYFIGDADDQEVPELAPPNLPLVEPGLRRTVPLPHQPGRVSLSFSRINSGGVIAVAANAANNESKRALSPSPAKINLIYLKIRWTPTSTTPAANEPLPQPKVFQRTLRDTELTFEQDLLGGIIEIESSHPVGFQASWVNLDADKVAKSPEGEPVRFGQSIPLNTEPQFVRTYLADDRPMTFSIRHLDNQPTPFRLSCRVGVGAAFLSDDIQTARSHQLPWIQEFSFGNTFEWDYLDQQSQVVDAGRLAFAPPLSIYDRLVKSGTAHQVSQRQHFFFSIPANVRQLRIRSPQTALLVRGAVRPPLAPVLRRVPESYYPYERQFEMARKWFTIHPDASSQLIANNRSFVLETQPKPRSDDAEELPQHPEFTTYQPAGSWFGRQVLTPAMAETQLNARNLKFNFFELNPGQQYTLTPLDFTHPFGGQLIYTVDHTHPTNHQRSQNNLGTLTIRIDDQILQRVPLLSTRGEVNLEIPTPDPNGPSQPPQTVQIDAAENVRLFLAGLNIQHAKRFIKRTAARFQNGKMEFQYDKLTAGEETLSLRVFEEGEKKRRKLSIKILADQNIRLQATGPVEMLTSPHRIYDFLPQALSDTVVIGSDASICVEHNCFVTMGSDLPPGQYTIRIDQIDHQDPGYVVLRQSVAPPPTTLPSFPETLKVFSSP